MLKKLKKLVEDAYNEEYLTAFADIVQNNKAIYTQNENVFTQLGDFLKPIFRKKGYCTIKFNTGQDVYDFIKTIQSALKYKLKKVIVASWHDMAHDDCEKCIIPWS